MSKSKDTKQVWFTVRSLSSRKSYTTGKFLLCEGRVYAIDRAMTSAFVQEYAKVSGRKSDKDFRNVVMDLRFLDDSHVQPRGSWS